MMKVIASQRDFYKNFGAIHVSPTLAHISNPNSHESQSIINEGKIIKWHIDDLKQGYHLKSDKILLRLPSKMEGSRIPLELTIITAKPPKEERRLVEIFLDDI